jgi:hypothetical protein
MGVTYFKRFRMEMPLNGWRDPPRLLPAGYRLMRWDPLLVSRHADAKYRSFCEEIDAIVFPCFSERRGCLRLMTEIADKPGFQPLATWLLTYESPEGFVEDCGTVQGICDDLRCGSIQNLGITPEHRGRGLGTLLLLTALNGFWQGGLRRAALEVTAQNGDAVRLYRRLGFRRVKTVYKAVEVAYS